MCANGFYGLLDDGCAAEACDGDALAFQDGLAHVDAHAVERAVLEDEARHEDAGARLDREFFLACEVFGVDDAGEAADAVAAHFGFAAVRIEDLHPEIGCVRRQDEDQAVGADAVVTVAYRSGESGQIPSRELLLKAVHEHEIIAAALPFCE